MTQPLMTMQGMCRSAGSVEILRNVSLDIMQGEIIALVGPNGAGKSTLFRIMSLIEQPQSGTLSFGGQDIDDLGPADRLAARRNIACVLQSPSLFAGTVRSNVELGLKFRGEKADKRKKRAGQWMETLRIDHLAHRDVRTLSGGEQQRVSIARALAVQPKLLLLDEPFGALDEPTRKQLGEELRNILQNHGITAVFITHDRMEAIAMATHVAVMLQGELRQKGSVDSVFAHPADSDVAEFLGYGNVVCGQVRSSQDGMVCIELPNGGYVSAAGTAAVGSPATVLVHPEDIVLMAGEPEGISTSARNIVKGTVADMVPMGTTIKVVIDSGIPFTSVITRHAQEELSLQPGSVVTAMFKATATKFYT